MTNSNIEKDEDRKELQEEFILLAQQAKEYFKFEEDATMEDLAKMLDKMKPE